MENLSNMEKIRFSHLYLKFCGEMPKRALLLQVFKVNREDLSNAFVKYDTEYIENKERQFYPLPDTTLLVLLLIDEKQQMFTTVRTWYPEKERYYKSLEGKWIELVLE